MPEGSEKKPETPQSLDATSAAKFVELLTAHQRRLYAYISTLLLGDPAVADVLQDTNVDLWNRSKDFDFSRPFLPWAFAFARQRVMAHRKSQSRSRLLFSEAALARIEAECTKLAGEADSRLLALQVCLERLKPHQTQLIRERYFGRSSVRMIAARLGDTAHNISSQLYRIRRELAKCVDLNLTKELR